MKKILSRFCTFAAAAVVAASFTACSSEEGEIFSSKNGEKLGNSYSIKINAKKGNEATRALDLTSDVLTAYWKTTDLVYVYDEGWNQYNGNLHALADGSASNQVSQAEGTITVKGSAAEPAVGNKLNFIFPRTTWSYEGQDGTLETIAQRYDYAKAQATIETMNGNSITMTNPNPVDFKSMQAIVKFELKDNAGTNAISVRSLKIRTSNNLHLIKSGDFTHTTNYVDETGLDVTSTTDRSDWYVALCGVQTDDVLSIVAKDSNGKSYYFEKTISSAGDAALADGLENGKYYIIQLNQVVESPDNALTVEAKESGQTTVSYNFETANEPVLLKVFNSDNSLADKFYVTSTGSYSLTSGMKILFYSDNDTYTRFIAGDPFERDGDGNVIGIKPNGSNLEKTGTSHITVDKEAYLYNNIMSLVHGTDWATDDNTVLPDAQATFAGLFINSPFVQKTGSPLLLPATTLRVGCYQALLSGTRFSVAPELPATTLANYCYTQMFYGTPLVESPILPAETLVIGCYSYMFNSCASLTKVTCYAKTMPMDNNSITPQVIISNCTTNWLSGVPATGTFVLNGTINADYVTVADYFSKHSSETSYTYNGTNYNKSEFLSNNSYICFSLGTGGIKEGWTVTQATP
ncbi:MAG: hypothetical protein K6A98_06575 [Prevotella sp.]|nr:hypothetical protein [Prevotella sp.]